MLSTLPDIENQNNDNIELLASPEINSDETNHFQQNDSEDISYPSEENICNICYEHINDEWIIFDCNHKICLMCLQKLYFSQKQTKNTLCPFCRHVIDKGKAKPKIKEVRPRNTYFLWLQAHKYTCFILNVLFVGLFLFILSHFKTSDPNLLANTNVTSTALTIYDIY